ncbi:tRNA-modifying protein YgfZ [Buchnera aphidicola (Eriosoma lanigerum)]|uniref:tRNA-modifying protein YgfZ n=1 Tax=Buchnera aphidicola TaxID=9 RepID=UPI0034641DE7
MSNITLTDQFVCSINNLHTTSIILDDLSCIFIKGIDFKRYLQGQLTIDVFSLKINEHVMTAQCDVNGKVRSIIRLFFYDDGVMCIVRKSLVQQTLMTFKKYSLFSKVQIFLDDQIVLLGMIGLDIRIFLEKFFILLPNKDNIIIHIKNKISILWFNVPTERFLLLMPLSYAIDFQKKIKNLIHVYDRKYWKYLDIASGFPIFDKEIKSKFIPQSVNLDLFNGINYHKGCYIGQEIIAKIYFSQINYKKMYWLVGNINYIPVLGSILKVKNNDHFIYVGFILSVVRISSDLIWIQAILKDKISKESILYLNEDVNYPLYINDSVFYGNFIK